MDIIDVSFPVRAALVPRDHGFALYAALCRAMPSLHGAEWLGIHPLSGKPRELDGGLVPGPRSTLRLRLPVDKLTAVLPLMGTSLDVAGHSLHLDAPTIFPLVPASSLDARIVVLKLTEPPTCTSETESRAVLDNEKLAERYHQELTRQALALGVLCAPVLCGRAEIRVHGKRLVGFSVRFPSLSVDESLALQRQGLGGKRRMGCGVFRPTRGA